MTENEAVLNRMKQYRDYAVNELNMCGEMKKDFDTAIQALEEVQQYRAIEKRLADMFGDELSLENYVDMLEETLEDSIAEQDNPHIVKTRIVTMENVASLEAYRTIGTVEEIQQKMAELEQYRGMGSTPSQIYVRMGGYISELAKYAEIGTAEECREAVEKVKKYEKQYTNDMNNPLEPLKVSSALRSELIKLEYRKQNKPNDINILDYTIIAVLQKALGIDWGEEE